jgi:hypothetical protein
MIRKTAPLAAALLTLLFAATARADFMYAFTTTVPAANGGGSLSGSFTVADAVVATGNIVVTSKAVNDFKSLSFALSGTMSPFFDQTYTLADYIGADGTNPIPVNKTDGTFNYQPGASTTLHFLKSGENIDLTITQSSTTFEVSLLGEMPTDGTGSWTVTPTTTTVPAPSSIVLVIVGGACGVVGGFCRRLRRQQCDQNLQAL